MERKEDEIDDYDDVPLHRQKPFGSGLKRKPIAFVPASSGDLNTTEEALESRPNKSISDLYLSLVLPKPSSDDGAVAAGSDRRAQSESRAGETEEVCPVCKLPLTTSPEDQEALVEGSQSDGSAARRPKPYHESSIAHQVCLTHSHPPSALDRSRMGLTYLESYGWDPDSRQGLGTAGQGIQFPLKTRPKNDTLGLGVVIPPEFRVAKKEKPKPMDAKQARAKAREDKKKAERLRDQFYGSEDLEKYLGSRSAPR